MPPKKKPAPADPADGADDTDTDTSELDEAVERALGARLNPLVDKAISKHFKGFEKTLDERLAKLAPPKPEDKPEDKPEGAAGAAGKTPVDPETRKLREQLEQVTKKQADSEARARAAELKATRDAAHGDLRGQLDAMGIKGPRARAVIADLEQSGALRLNEESGQYELAVKRARAKGAKAEELVFDDLSAGLKDWAGTDDAKEFLPPPTGALSARRPAAGAQTAQGARRPAAQGDAPTFRTLNDDIRDFASDLVSKGGQLPDLADED